MRSSRSSPISTTQRSTVSAGSPLKTRYVNAGDLILRKDGAVRNVYFIASARSNWKLRARPGGWDGERMFGQMAILSARARRAEVRAIAPSTLLVLDEARFRRLLGRSAALQEAVRAGAGKARDRPRTSCSRNRP